MELKVFFDECLYMTDKNKHLTQNIVSTCVLHSVKDKA